METVSSVAVSTGDATVMRPRCSEARAAPTTLPTLVERSISTCACSAGWSKPIRTSSVLVRSTISATHLRWSGSSAKFRPPYARFMARAHPNTYPRCGPIGIRLTQGIGASSSNGFMKIIPRRSQIWMDRAWQRILLWVLRASAVLPAAFLTSLRASLGRIRCNPLSFRMQEGTAETR